MGNEATKGCISPGQKYTSCRREVHGKAKCRGKKPAERRWWNARKGTCMAVRYFCMIMADLGIQVG